MRVRPQKAARAPGDETPTARVSVPSVDASLGMKLLPAVLSLTPGSVDAISFLGLGGLFTAHITGNLVILASRIVAGGETPVAAPMERNGDQLQDRDLQTDQQGQAGHPSRCAGISKRRNRSSDNPGRRPAGDSSSITSDA